MEHLTISVILASRTIDSRVSQSFSCFEKQTIDSSSFEVILLSDPENYELAGELAQAHPDISFRFLPTDEEFHPGRARLQGLRAAKGDIVLFHEPELLPAEDMLEKHIEFHQMPSSEPCAVMSSVVVDSTLPPRFMLEGLQQANFLPGRTPHETSLDLLHLHGFSISVRQNEAMARAPRLFTTANVSTWGVERNLILELLQEQFRIVQHPTAVATIRPSYSVEEFCHAMASITRDIAQLSTELPDVRALCPTVHAFSPELLPTWSEHLAREKHAARDLRDYLQSMQNLVARYHTEQLAEQSLRTIQQIAESLLLIREYIAQQTMVRDYYEEAPRLNDAIERISETKTSECGATALQQRLPKVAFYPQ